MGVVSTKRLSKVWDGTRNSKGTHTYNVRYVVSVDSLEDGPVAVADANDSVPIEGAIYDTGVEADSLAVVKTIKASRDPRAPLVWYVDLQYETLVVNWSGATDGAGEPIKPTTAEEAILMEPPSVVTGSETMRVVARTDINGDRICTSSGEEFVPGIERNVILPTVRITRNEAACPLNRQVAFTDTVNANEFMGQSAGKVWLRDMSSNWALRYGVSYWRVSYDIVFNAALWTEKPLDQGLYKSTTGSATEDITASTRILDNDGVPIQKPMMLDGSGGVLATSADPEHLSFDMHTSTDFDDLDLPDIFALGAG